MSIIQKAWTILTADDRSLFRRDLIFVLFESLWNFFALISLIPFLFMVVNPEVMTSHKQLAWVRGLLGSPSPDTFLVIVGCFAFAVLILGNIYNLFLVRQNFRFISAITASISSRIFERCLSREYIDHINSDMAHERDLILRNSRGIAEYWISGFHKLVSTAFTVLLIAATILISAPVVAAMTIFLFGGLYVWVYVVVRKKIKRLGTHINSANIELGRITTDSLNAIKEIMIFNKTREFVEEHRRWSTAVGELMTASAVASHLPRYSIEVLAFGVLLLTTIYMLLTVGTASETIPVIGIFAFACQKLAPALRMMFSVVTSMRFNVASLHEVHAILQQAPAKARMGSTIEPLPFCKSFSLRDVSFRYPSAQQNVLSKIDFSINRGTKCSIIGASGRGKTTLINIMSGLLFPESGDFLVDGHRLSPGDLPRWRENIAYVGQDMFLFNSTIGRNIAFSLYDFDYDREKVIASAKSAAIHDFIVGLAQGYDTPVGQNGIRMSGGQRQRIAIARALYKDVDILLLDEATNALDDTTEESFFANLATSLEDKTIILITHSLKSAARCDTIFDLESRGHPTFPLTKAVPVPPDLRM